MAYDREHVFLALAYLVASEGSELETDLGVILDREMGENAAERLLGDICSCHPDDLKSDAVALVLNRLTDEE